MSMINQARPKNPSGSHPQRSYPKPPAAEFIAFGSRAGMEITVVSKQGIGTVQAVIRARLTAENAKRYCDNYVRDSSQRCIEEFLSNTRLADSITANCESGTFTTFYGEKFQFLGKSLTPDSMAAYVVRNLKDNSTLDGSSASGLSYNMDQFNALCPGRSTIAMKQMPPTVQPKSDTQKINRELQQCLLPEAQYGKYSSFDGGKSANSLLDKCKREYLAWVDECERNTSATGDTTESCIMKVMIAAQAAIKLFGK
ncbi:MAG: hypothetical protein HYX37_14100 [Rhizobiales bacterium]|nr:hypothetical protein [Hyphomicrobiales bacterium]